MKTTFAKKTGVAMLAMAAMCLGGCAKDQLAPLVFVQSNAFGVVANAGTTSQGAELTVGYHNYDVAIVPVTVKDSAGSVHELQAFTSNGAPTCPTPVTNAATDCVVPGIRDALSVIGQFEGSTSATPTGLPGVGFGSFFATGQAAATLAQGFSAKLGKTP